MKKTHLRLVSMNTDIVPQKSTAKLRLVSANEKVIHLEDQLLNVELKQAIRSLFNQPSPLQVIAQVNTTGKSLRIILEADYLQSQVWKESSDFKGSWEAEETLRNSPENAVWMKNWLIRNIATLTISDHSNDGIVA